MSKQLPSVPLPTLAGGVNRFSRDSQGATNQCIDALDVIEDDGDVRRRDAFRAIATGAPFILPSGKTIVRHRAGGTFNDYYDRAFSVSASSIGATPDYDSPPDGSLWVLCTEPFDGIDWRHITPPQWATANARLKVSYLKSGNVFSSAMAVVDTTEAAMSDASGNRFTQTLCQDGRISWHRSQFVDWVTASVGGEDYYAVALWVDSVTGALTGSGSPSTLAMGSPGPRPFLLEPVTAIMPFSSRTGRSFLLVGNDRQPARGKEFGAQLGNISTVSQETDTLRLSDGSFIFSDEGSGISGQVTPPGWRKWTGSDLLSGTPQGAYSGGSFVASTDWSTPATPSAVGTANKVTRLVAPATARLKINGEVTATAYYEWFADQFRGGQVTPDFSPQASPIVNDSTSKRGSITVDLQSSTLTGLQNRFKDGDFEDFRLQCIAGESIYLEEREIYEITVSSDILTIKFHDHFSGTPTDSHKFRIYRPHAKLKYRHNNRLYEVIDNDATTLQVTNAGTGGRPFDPEWAAEDKDRFCHFEVGRELRWTRRSGDFWVSVFDPITSTVLLTNGETEILTYDGKTLRVLQSNIDTSDERVRQLVGAVAGLEEDELTGVSGPELAGSHLRNAPPVGKFLASFNGRVCVANLPGRPREVVFSKPDFFNDIWFHKDNAIIRDEENDEISGLATFQNKLLVFTPTAIHASAFTQDGGIFFSPVSVGVGFLSHRAVTAIGESALIGPTADGVYIFDGFQMRPVLDDWKRLLEHGVNVRLLSQSVGAASLHRTEYYLAVPSAGSRVLDRILVFNWTQNKWWVWTSPWGGISSVARDLSPFGEERILFGTNDGHIAVLRKADTDDGDAILGRARSPLIQPALTATVAPTAVMLMAEESGSAVQINTYLNNRPVWSSPSLTYSGDSGLYSSARFEQASPAYSSSFGGDRVLTKKVDIKSFARTEGFQFEISGTGQWRIKSAELLMGPISRHRST